MATKITGKTLNKLGIPLALGVLIGNTATFHFAYDDLPKGIFVGSLGAILTIGWYTGKELLSKKIRERRNHKPNSAGPTDPNPITNPTP